MRDEQVKLLTVHLEKLLRLTELQSFAKIIFTETEVRNLFGNHDERYNRERFFQAFTDKDETAYHSLVDWLNTIGQSELARQLAAEKSGITPFREPLDENNEEDADEITSSIESEVISSFDESRTPMTIDVRLATEFLDTSEHNPNIPFYSCRSKRRGKVLIINNYVFHNEHRHKRRTGAKVDESNLTELFKQMGGWKVQIESNLTTDDMRSTLKKFAKSKGETHYDTCFVFIMSHGEDRLNETIIYGTDGQYLTTSSIQDYFTNRRCPMFLRKPKVFIYQVCRGLDLDLATKSSTEFDGRRKNATPLLGPEMDKSINQPAFEHFRPVEDMLIGHATMQGSKAHRDPFRGTWYIELICEHFMKLAKDESVVDLLVKVDEGLRKRKSEFGTVQTSEHTSKGFKKLYLNPGIYEENGNLVAFEPKVVASS